MTTEQYLKTRLADNDLAEPFLKCLEHSRGLELQNAEMRTALEIAKPSTIHVLSGHVYDTDDKLLEFVDGCARCRIEKILSEGAVKPKARGTP